MLGAILDSAHEAVLPFLVCLVVALATAAILLRWRAHWGPVRASLIASACLPTLGVAFCLWVFVRAATDTREHCGVDACGMAMAFSMIIAIDFLAIFLVTALLCYTMLRVLRRRK
jgi:hypothetical protein